MSDIDKLLQTAQDLLGKVGEVHNQELAAETQRADSAEAAVAKARHGLKDLLEATGLDAPSGESSGSSPSGQRPATNPPVPPSRDETTSSDEGSDPDADLRREAEEMHRKGVPAHHLAPVFGISQARFSEIFGFAPDQIVTDEMLRDAYGKKLVAHEARFDALERRVRIVETATPKRRLDQAAFALIGEHSAHQHEHDAHGSEPELPGSDEPVQEPEEPSRLSEGKSFFVKLYETVAGPKMPPAERRGHYM